MAPVDEEQIRPLKAPAAAASNLLGLSLFRTWHFWVFAWVFAGVEALCLLISSTTLMGLVTAFSYGDVGAHSSADMSTQLLRLHVYCAMALWLFGSVNTLAPSLRKNKELTCIHKGIGYAFLGLWALIVGPTSMYLSLKVRGDPIFGTLASVVLLDVTFLTYYYFWRAWRCARERRQDARSLALHGNLMALGLLGTMSQIPQRVIQLLLIGLRAGVLTLLSGIDSPTAALTLGKTLSHEVLFGQSMLAGNIFMIVLVDGPRTEFLKDPKQYTRELRVSLYGETDADEQEMYPYDLSNPRVRWQWRARIVTYFLLRGAAATAGWI